jgi:hypothetical protein
VRRDPSTEDGVTKSIAAGKIAGITRIILVSVFPEAWRERHRNESLEHYIVVKKKADVELVQSGLDWVILCRSALKNDPGVGTVTRGGGITRDPATTAAAKRRRDPVEGRAFGAQPPFDPIPGIVGSRRPGCNSRWLGS